MGRGGIGAAVRRLLPVALLLAPAVARAEWNRAETPHFELLAELPAPETERIAGEIEALDALLREVTGIRAIPATRIRITVFGDVETVRELMALPAFEGGVTQPTPLGAMAIVAQRNKARPDYVPRESLFHEYAHAFMIHNMPEPHPGWFVEGFASLFETAVPLPDGRMRFGDHGQWGHVLKEAGPVPFARIESMVAERRDGPPPAMLYAGGWLLTHHYYFDGPRRAEIERYLAAFAAGAADGGAGSFFTGGVDGLDTELGRYVRAALPPPRELLPPPGAVPALRPMRAAEVEMLALEVGAKMHIMGGAEAGDAEQFEMLRAYFAKVDAVCRRYPEEAEIARFAAVLAMAVEEFGRVSEIVDATARADGTESAPLLALKGMAVAEAANAGEGDFDAGIARSRALIERALKLDPQEPLALEAMYRNLTLAEGATPKAIAYLERALKADPTLDHIRVRLAELMARNGNSKGAIAALSPIANSPHASPQRDDAIRDIAAIRAGRSY